MTKLEALLAASPVIALFGLLAWMTSAVLRHLETIGKAQEWSSADWDEDEFDMAPTMSADYLKAYSKGGER